MGRLERALRAAVGAAALLALPLTLYGVACSPQSRVLWPDPTAPWIMADLPVSGAVQQWGRIDAPPTRFVRSFALDAAPAHAPLVLRSFGSAQLSVNGEPIVLGTAPRAAGPRFRAEADVAAALRAGDNRLEVEVRDTRGPGLLSLRLDAGGLRIATGTEWQAIGEDGAARRALLASDLRPHPSALAGERAPGELRERWDTVAGCFVASLCAFLALRGRAEAAPAAPLGRGLLALATLAWLLLFARKFAEIDLRTGFDAQNHLLYLDTLRRNGRLPLATDGWSMYHPPLFYLLSAAVSALAQLAGAARDGLALKLLPFLAGLGNVMLSASLVRRFLPADRAAHGVALAFAAVLPMNLYVAAYFSNEGLAAFLSSAVLLASADFLLAERVSLRRAALLSALAGLALLGKYTAFVVVALALPAAALRILAETAQPVRARAWRLAGLALPLLAIAGWFYARNIWLLGRPLVPNWDLPRPDQAWWSPPGFHTPAYYLRFGESLVRPFFSGYVSFWDAIYSTLWGDGFLAGRSMVSARHSAWDYGSMAAGYLLALPATLLLLLGWARAGWWALRHPAARQRAASALVALQVAALGFGVLYATFSLPYFGQAKAFYALAAMPALTLFFALGFRALDAPLARRANQGLRGLLWGWLGAFCVVLYLGFAA